MPKKSAVLLTSCFAFVIVFLVIACSGRNAEPPSKGDSSAMTIKLTGSAFAEGQPIPTKYTCDGADVSPPLKWSDVPEGARSLALICDDPDAPAGDWTHWVLFNIPPTVTELAEAVPTTETISNGAKQGRNDFKRIGYGGPCPPQGRAHRYFFRLYALKTEINLNAGATKQDVINAMKGNILAEAELMGTYKRK